MYKPKKNVLDICCGTGQLVLKYLKNNFQVTVIDLSPHMLSYVREDTREYLNKGAVKIYRIRCLLF